MRFGIIACSSVARRRFLPALKASSLAVLEHVGSRNLNKARTYAKEFSSPKFGTYKEVIADKDVDAVYISTPPFLHREWVIKAAEHGKHVICEKPAFPDYKTACEVVRICRANGVRLIENYMFRCHPQHERVARIVSKGDIGEPQYFFSEFTYPLPPSGNFRFNPDLGGGVFHDAAGYPVAAAILQFQTRPVSIVCETGFDEKKLIDNAFCAIINFPNGRQAHVFSAFGIHYRSRYAIVGSKGRIEVERAFAVPPNMETIITVEKENGAKRIIVPPANQFQLILEDFCREISGATLGGEDFEGDLLIQHAVMDAAARSAKTKRLVKISYNNLH